MYDIFTGAAGIRIHIYAIFNVAASICMRPCCDTHVVCIFAVYSMRRHAFCIHIYCTFAIQEHNMYFICIFTLYYTTTIFSISMIHCMKMRPPLCCGRRLYAFLRCVSRLGCNFTSITEHVYDKFYCAASVRPHFYDINKQRKRTMGLLHAYLRYLKRFGSPPCNEGVARAPPRSLPGHPGASK